VSCVQYGNTTRVATRCWLMVRACVVVRLLRRHAIASVEEADVEAQGHVLKTSCLSSMSIT